MVKYLVGLQSDLTLSSGGQNRPPKFEEINQCKEENGFSMYMETSAKSGLNVRKLFVLLAEQIT